MARVKIENLKSEPRNLDEKEMKKLFGGIFSDRFKLPDLNAKGNDVSIVTIELVHEGLDRIE